MQEAHKVDVWDQGSRTRLAGGGDENNEGFGVQARQSVSMRERQRQRGNKALVHGDDFVSSGGKAELEWLCTGLKKQFETKMTMMGEDDDLAKEARVLNRIVRWHPRKGITDEADTRHAEINIRDTGVENLKPISTLAMEEVVRESEEEELRQELNGRRLSGKLGSKVDDDDKDDALK